MPQPTTPADGGPRSWMVRTHAELILSPTQCPRCHAEGGGVYLRVGRELVCAKCASAAADAGELVQTGL